MSQFTLGSVVKSMTCLAITTVLVWPVVAGQTPLDAIIRQSFQNARTLGAAMELYTSDWDQVLPRLDNNGSCYFEQTPCDMPDWNNLELPRNSVQTVESAKRILFFGALIDYLPNQRMVEDPLLGPTDWETIMQRRQSMALILPNWVTIEGERRAYLEATLPAAAVNFLAVDLGAAYGVNSRPMAPKGRISMFSHPESTVLLAMTSTWDYGTGAKYGMGDLTVWPSWPNVSCFSYDFDGWTRYSLPRTAREGIHPYQGMHTDLVGEPKRGQLNPYLLGRAAFLYADGHAGLMTYPESEECVPTPTGHAWQSSIARWRKAYYPLWVPEAIP